VNYSGLLREGKLETLWFVVSDGALVAEGPGKPAAVKKLPWWRAVATNADTFVRRT
jgi:hypothetical protein